MVYIRSKKVKGIDYAYLVKSVWNSNKNSSLQKTIKYLGKTSSITIEDIPEDYRNDPKIITFMTLYASKDLTKKQTLLSRLREEFFKTLCDGDVSSTIKIYEKYTRFYNLKDFYDNLLKPVMYKIGELWADGKLDIATEHVCSNTAQSLIGIINEHLKIHRHKVKVLICTPNGELHSLGCKVIESFLISKGFKVFNISPSVQAESVISYIQEIKPDVIFISISIEENIKAGKNLVKKIRSIFSSKPILVGGIAIAKRDKLNFDAKILPNGSLREIETELKSINRIP